MSKQERIPSYGILDKIDHEIFMAIQNRDVIDCVSDATNNILALIAEAMMSEEVYRVMADGVDRLLPEAERDMRAALVAAGITGAGQEGASE